MELRFTGPQAGKRFELLYIALLNGGDGKGDRSPATIRREVRLFDLLDAISEPMNGNPEARLLKDGEHTVTLTPEDYALLHGYAQTTAWTPRAARAAVDLWEWLKTADTREL